jgi:hypothetical protein
VRAYFGRAVTSASDWVEKFLISYSPLISSFHPELHLMTMKMRDSSSDEIIYRLLLNELQLFCVTVSLHNVRLENLGEKKFSLECKNIFSGEINYNSIFLSLSEALL